MTLALLLERQTRLAIKISLPWLSGRHSPPRHLSGCIANILTPNIDIALGMPYTSNQLLGR